MYEYVLRGHGLRLGIFRKVGGASVDMVDGTFTLDGGFRHLQSVQEHEGLI